MEGPYSDRAEQQMDYCSCVPVIYVAVETEASGG